MSIANFGMQILRRQRSTERVVLEERQTRSQKKGSQRREARSRCVSFENNTFIPKTLSRYTVIKDIIRVRYAIVLGQKLWLWR